MTREGIGNEEVVSKLTRWREYPAVLTFAILCPVVYNAPCCAYKAFFANSNPWKVLNYITPFTANIYAFESNIERFV